ncbi:hypothetical protein [Acinetobacter boissieri]|uniref:Uncharacterized protein n=1 Tax=Acinetobacter boissieri TaxID=1219383 RepID=A0A1G6H0N0_9GAMM|nr:hypothetical protein [Acinetobacter boissieri]SDB86936.1 hypothetical protein SAMN05421733_10321 [Acinetobacter boissieri]
MTTKILGEAVGVQWQGVQDRTQGQPSSNGVPLLVGSFKRGRTDKPMLIHNGNIKSELGYEPHNPDYIAVQSMLDMGVSNINVLKVNSQKQESELPIPAVPPSTNISCDGAMPIAVFSLKSKTTYGFGGMFLSVTDKDNNRIDLAPDVYSLTQPANKDKYPFRVFVDNLTDGDGFISTLYFFVNDDTCRITDLSFIENWQVSDKNTNPCIYTKSDGSGKKIYDICLKQEVLESTYLASNSAIIRLFVKNNNDYADNIGLNRSYSVNGINFDRFMEFLPTSEIAIYYDLIYLGYKVNLIESTDGVYIYDLVITNTDKMDLDIKNMFFDIKSKYPQYETYWQKPPEISPLNTNKTLTLTDTGFNFTLLPI